MAATTTKGTLFLNQMTGHNKKALLIERQAARKDQMQEKASERAKKREGQDDSRKKARLLAKVFAASDDELAHLQAKRLPPESGATVERLALLRDVLQRHYITLESGDNTQWKALAAAHALLCKAPAPASSGDDALPFAHSDPITDEASTTADLLEATAPPETSPMSQTLPFDGPLAGVPQLTLEQYAAFSGEVSQNPGKVAEARRRYGLENQAAQQRLVQHWMSLFASDLSLERRYQELLRSYRS